jgi:hypothetical protein
VGSNAGIDFAVGPFEVTSLQASAGELGPFGARPEMMERGKSLKSAAPDAPRKHL